MTNQDKILRILWKKNRKMTINELSNDSRLDYVKVKSALYRLKQRNLIVKEYEHVSGKGGNKDIPIRKLLTSINKRQLNRINDLMENA